MKITHTSNWIEDRYSQKVTGWLGKNFGIPDRIEFCPLQGEGGKLELNGR